VARGKGQEQAGTSLELAKDFRKVYEAWGMLKTGWRGEGGEGDKGMGRAVPQFSGRKREGGTFSS